MAGSQTPNKELGFYGDYERYELALLADIDLHKETAALISGIPIAQITPEQRKIGKL